MSQSLADLRVALVHMPVANHLLPNLAIERLAQVLRRHGAVCSTLYGTLKFIPALPIWLRYDSIAPVFFAPSYYNEPTQVWLDRIERHMTLYTDPDKLTEHYWTCLEQAMMSAEACLSRCIEQIVEEKIEIVGISIGFDAQRLPSAALAKALRRVRPDIRIIAGGTACDGRMGKSLLSLFPEFDAVVSGEAEMRIVDILRNLRDGNGVTDPGVWTKQRPADEAEHPVSPLADLPCPDYDQFFAQVAESPFSKDVDAYRTVLYEGSRGCWYGQKNHCTFCGIRAVDFEYRTNGAVGFVEDILAISARWRPDLIYLTDAILSRDAWNTVIPELERLHDEASITATIFAETKSNLSGAEVYALSRAHIKVIQPGIETFLTNSLRRMKKGASGIQQIELIKWCHAFGVTPVYSLLLGVPGETATEQFTLAELCRRLHHLPPPQGANELGIHRFSPYFESPLEHGIAEVIPFEYQRLLYRQPDHVLLDLCYEFDHRLTPYDDMPTAESFGAVKEEVERWKAAYSTRRLSSTQHADHTVVINECDGQIEISTYEGAAAYILGMTVHATSRSRLLLEGAQFGAAALESALEDLESNGMLLRLDNRYLSLTIPKRPAAHVRQRHAHTRLIPETA